MSIHLWDVAAGKPIATLIGHARVTYPGHTGGLGFSVIALAFSADGQTLASGSYDTTIKLWRVMAKPKATD